MQPPMRPGNAVEVLIDGAQALPAIAAELRQAQSHVHLTGWHFSPDFALTRDHEPLILRNLLAELAERLDVRVLAWAGAPLPLFRPSRADVRKMRDQLIRHTKIQCALKVTLVNSSKKNHLWIRIDGDPPLDVLIKGGTHGDRGTIGTGISAIPVVIAAAPGLKTVLDLPLYGPI